MVGGQGRSLWIDLRVPRGTAWGGAARQVEAVSDGGEGVRGRSGRAGAGLVASSGGIGAVGRRRGCVGRCV